MSIAHSAITDPDIHEPKGIAAAAANAVHVANGAGSGTWTVQKQLNRQVVCCNMADIGAVASAFAACPFAGKLIRVDIVIYAAITTADAIVSIKIGGVAVTPATVTVPFTASAAGTVASATITATNTITAGQNIEAASNGGPANSVAATIIFTIDVS